jgi:DNA-binding IclR family transcriptional regulator
MSQEEVLSWLEAHPGWHKTIEIKKAIGKEASSVRGSLNALAKHGEIKKRLLGNGPKAGLEWSV